jgi:hypothetical protein
MRISGAKTKEALLKLSRALLCVNDVGTRGGGSRRLLVRPGHADCNRMKTFIGWLVWCLLFVLCWPIAILALGLFPLVWLISLPLRLVGISFEAVFALISALLSLPTKLLRGGRQKVA